MIRRPPRSTLDRSSAASDVYKRQVNVMCVDILRPIADPTKFQWVTYLRFNNSIMPHNQRILVLSIVLGTFQLGAAAQKECPLTHGNCPLSSESPEFGRQEIGFNAVSWINAELGTKGPKGGDWSYGNGSVSYTHLRAHETVLDLV